MVITLTIAFFRSTEQTAFWFASSHVENLPVLAVRCLVLVNNVLVTLLSL